MKGRYGGRHMTIYGSVLPGAIGLARWAARTNLTEQAKRRLKVVDWLRAHHHDVSLTARHFGLNRETVRIWRDKFTRVGMIALNEKSHRPKHVRQSMIDWKVVDEIVQTRKQYPAWSKYKIKAILKRKNMAVSASTIGRILKKKNLIDQRVSRKRYKAAKHPKSRYPKGLRISLPGDMVQIDTKFVTMSNRMIYQFTAIDVLTKRRVLRYYSSLLSKNGAHFLGVCMKQFPFEIRTVQTDNGKEFLKHFEIKCKQLRLMHYFIDPHTPKQNTFVENSHGSDEREFYQQGNVHKDIEAMDAALTTWEHEWNFVRPHQSLSYLTPDEYLHKLKQLPLQAKEAIVLQA